MSAQHRAQPHAGCRSSLKRPVLVGRAPRDSPLPGRLHWRANKPLAQRTSRAQPRVVANSIVRDVAAERTNAIVARGAPPRNARRSPNSGSYRSRLERWCVELVMDRNSRMPSSVEFKLNRRTSCLSRCRRSRTSRGRPHDNGNGQRQRPTATASDPRRGREKPLTPSPPRLQPPVQATSGL
jgi:hypothetical protein